MLIISGPAGSGKNTVSERLMSEFPQIKRVVTSTSRPPRGAEKDGVDYHFLSPENFVKGIENGDFFEYAKVHDRYYGTSKKAVYEALEKGDDLILIIDVQGAAQLALSLPEARFVFILPPSLEVLARRLRDRGTDSEDVIKRRLAANKQKIQT